ncbi:MAG: aminodeoxychorismate synthase component I [Planctomycetes bacterium]|nr:aminodeoxychorismate synthase component I [Planctomycetota bacterium]
MSVFDELLAAPAGEPKALLHSCGAGRDLLFRVPVETLEVGIEDVADAFDRLRAFLARHRDRVAVGYCGYDLRDAVEPLPHRIDDDWPLPVLRFVAFAEVLESSSEPVPPAPSVHGTLAPHLSRADYEALVAEVVEHIRAGDIFQANLTQPFTGTFEGDARALFWRLCEVSPAPFAAYLDDGRGHAVLSSSPEELVRRDGDRLRTRPIKGTRPRHAEPSRDRALLAELLTSEKDLAELAMIVDLLRNDFGKVAATGSVAVGPFPEHASFAQVHHLFATVTARLRSGLDHVDVLRAIFPGGSITGAPKLRAMEILEELELVRRGVYTGAIGFVGPGDRMHLNVAIRTMQVAGSKVRCNAGGGITADSDPAMEFDETIAKARGMMRALGVEPEA